MFVAPIFPSLNHPCAFLGCCYLFDDVLFYQAPEVEANSYPDLGNVKWLEKTVQSTKQNFSKEWMNSYWKLRHHGVNLFSQSWNPLGGGGKGGHPPPGPTRNASCFTSYLCENTCRELCVICEKNVTRKSEMVRIRKNVLQRQLPSSADAKL